jgi:hypothetical protein
VKLAHITPISLLDTIPDEQHVHLVLSELVITVPRYCEFYLERRMRGDIVILDNPVHENHPVSIERWLEAIYAVTPDIAVIPDVIDSRDETERLAVRALHEFSRRGFLDVELMAVPHGQEQTDWLDCALRLAKFGKPLNWFGVSLERRLNDDTLALERRRNRLQYLIDYPHIFDRIKLHLLGISESAAELGEDRIWRRATSADVSKFAVWNMLRTPVKPPPPVTIPYPGRQPFGGSYRYFFTGQPQWVSRRKMRNNLREWNRYAEREDEV